MVDFKFTSVAQNTRLEDAGPIKFGTSGWRGVLAKEVTFQRVARLSRSMAFLIKQHSSSKKITIRLGYDTRFLSRVFAELMATIFANAGINVDIEDDVCTTPALVYCTMKGPYDLGVNITASHNPFYFHGVKIITSSGLAGNSLTKNIERLCLLDQSNGPLDIYSQHEGNVREVSARRDYVEHILEFLDVESIRESAPFVVYDPLYGCASKCFGALFSKLGVATSSIHGYPDPWFGGLLEAAPSPHTLKDLSREVIRSNALLGLASDGDGDRFGVIDFDGSFVKNNDVIALLVDYLYKEKKLKGPVVRSVSSSTIIDRIANNYKESAIESPVGFKNITSIMGKCGANVGVEESGGFSYAPNLPDKDGIMADMLVLEMRLKSGRSIKDELELLYNRYGRFYHERFDLPVGDNSGESKFNHFVNMLPKALPGSSMIKDSTVDGFKRFYENDSWILLRRSGTENRIRIYVETKLIEVFNATVNWVTSLT